MQSVSTLGYSPNCYYWASNPYGTAKCVSYSSTGECSKYQLANGSNLPSNYNGPRENCTEFANAILSNLKIIKTCAGNAYPDCIPEYAGNDTIKKANNDDLDDIAIKKATTGCAGWRKNNIAKSSRAYVLANGQILITYGSSFSPTIFAIDINGKKPPNKWGYDLFEFSTIGSMSSEVSMDYGRCGLVEKGGVSTKSMLLKVNK